MRVRVADGEGEYRSKHVPHSYAAFARCSSFAREEAEKRLMVGRCLHIMCLDSETMIENSHRVCQIAHLNYLER